MTEAEKAAVVARDDDNGARRPCPSPPSTVPPSSSVSSVPRDTSEYSKIEYWDRRFEIEEEYEWCGRFEDFGELLVAALQGGGGGGGSGEKKAAAAKRVLVLGSGTSRLPFDLASEESLLGILEEVVATDLSAVAVEKMAARARKEEEEAEREGG